MQRTFNQIFITFAGLPRSVCKTVHVTSGGAHLRGLAPGQLSSEEHRNGGEPLATLCRFDRPGNRNPDLLHR